ncbi:hypothetical protein HPB48_010503 [Haemaphysalis longicornis]|uniref:Gustatory receptor n=1 Tax=Haemaphysalis longicornis TaxID=44386 RepID=A0A9J6FPY5_HAELO|nr:hypothetical protein HPB48_010503 [Haemaphysalis longicornis]
MMFRKDIFPAEAAVRPFHGKTGPIIAERAWDGEKDNKNTISSWILLKLALMYVYSIHIVSNAIAGSIRTSSLAYIIETLTYTVRSLVSTITTTYAVTKRAEISGIADELATFEGLEPAEFLRKAAAKRRYLRFSVACYSLLLIATTCLFFVLVPAQKYFDKCFYGINLVSAGIPNGAAILIGMIEWNSYNLIVTGSPLLMTEYMYLCDRLRAQMLSFRVAERAVLDSGPLDNAKFQKVRNLCTRLIDVERRLDSMFSPVVLLWFIDLLVNIVLPIRTLINGIASFTIANVMSFFIEVVYSVSFFMTFSFSLAQVDKEYKELEEETFRLRNAVPVDDWQLCQQVSLLESGINASRFTLSAWGLFEVDRSFILTIAGAVATYTVVLIQLTPGQETY